MKDCTAGRHEHLMSVSYGHMENVLKSWKRSFARRNKESKGKGKNDENETMDFQSHGACAGHDHDNRNEYERTGSEK